MNTKSIKGTPIWNINHVITMHHFLEACKVVSVTLELLVAVLTMTGANFLNNSPPYTYVCKGTYLSDK